MKAVAGPLRAEPSPDLVLENLRERPLWVTNGVIAACLVAAVLLGLRQGEGFSLAWAVAFIVALALLFGFSVRRVEVRRSGDVPILVVRRWLAPATRLPLDGRTAVDVINRRDRYWVRFRHGWRRGFVTLQSDGLETSRPLLRTPEEIEALAGVVTGCLHGIIAARELRKYSSIVSAATAHGNRRDR